MTINMLTAENQMKKDITNRADVEFLIDSFIILYKRMLLSATFLMILLKLTGILICRKCITLGKYNFAKKVYTGNPMRKTSELAKKSPLKL